MTPLTAPSVVLTHESDLDGLLSGLLLVRLARARFGTEVPLQAWNYQGWRNRQMSDRVAWVSDFTFEPRLDRPGWLVVDHHAFEGRPTQARLIHDPAQSAAGLVYGLCREAGLASPVLDRLVHLNNLSDLWRNQDPEFDLATDYAGLVKDYGFWNLHHLIAGDPERLLDHPLLEVMAVRRRVENPIGYDWCARHVEAVAPGVGVVHTSVGDSNLIVHQLLDRAATPHSVLITLFPKANRTVVASIRSLRGEALGVAAQLQGGGHPNAAGATLPRSVTDVASAVEYLRECLHPHGRDADLLMRSGQLHL
ncbi:MAG: DHH family phosphoesterase [Verrucomicrobia bacterium]|nr:DHH family phosphoesterase [Verrucomicrobiota bacterium]